MHHEGRNEGIPIGVLDGQSVNQSITNPAFINKNVDDVMPNKLGFDRPLSGPTIADIQQAVNNLYTATGVSESQSGTTYNATPGTITNGDSHQLALTKLANKFDPATGHFHTGSAGDGPLLNVVTSLVTPSGGSPIFGDLTLIAGNNMAITQSATGFTFDSFPSVGTTIAASGNPDLSGQVILVAGTGVLLNQIGQNIVISASGGGGGGSGNVTIQTSNYTALSSDDIILVDASSNPVEITLPLAITLSGHSYSIKKIDNSTNVVTILPSGSDLIDGEISQIYNAPMTSVIWDSDGISNWYGF